MHLPFLFFIATYILTFLFTWRDPDQTIAKFPAKGCFWWNACCPRTCSSFSEGNRKGVTMPKIFIHWDTLGIKPTLFHFFCQLFCQLGCQFLQTCSTLSISGHSRMLRSVFQDMLAISTNKQRDQGGNPGKWLKKKLAGKNLHQSSLIWILPVYKDDKCQTSNADICYNYNLGAGFRRPVLCHLCSVSIIQRCERVVPPWNKWDTECCKQVPDQVWHTVPNNTSICLHVQKCLRKPIKLLFPLTSFYCKITKKVVFFSMPDFHFTFTFWVLCPIACVLTCDWYPISFKAWK